MDNIKQLASFIVLNVNGGDRVTYTYDELDPASGDMISSNNKGSFFIVDDGLKKDVEKIRKYINDNKLK